MSSGGQAGIALILAPCYPAGDRNADLEAADRMDGFTNRWFLDALYRGQYPEDMVRLYGDAMPEIAPGDMELISQPTDFLGVNYYTRSVVAYDPAPTPLQARRSFRRCRGHRDGLGGLPQGLFEVRKRVHDDYGPRRILITKTAPCSMTWSWMARSTTLSARHFCISISRRPIAPLRRASAQRVFRLVLAR